MTTRFHITGSRASRPYADRIAFCDGGVDDTYREGIDIELSHWIPNWTPLRLKADTSTEICLKFIESGDAANVDLVINNHVDVDGVLSVFVLLFPEIAIRHRRTVVQAAEMGDFWGWGEPPAQALFQALACLIVELRRSDSDMQEIYHRCFERAHAVLAGEVWAQQDAGLEALQESVARIDNGSIDRTPMGAHFVHYAIPRKLAMTNPLAALHVPAFNAPLSRDTLLAPQARARLDRERVHLVSVESDTGCYYDLWYPGYTWADTVSLWQAPGVRSAGSSNTHHLEYTPLENAVAELARRETATGRWVLARKLSPFATLPGRNFSVVLSFLDGNTPVPSALSPSTVAELLWPIFETETKSTVNSLT